MKAGPWTPEVVVENPEAGVTSRKKYYIRYFFVKLEIIHFFSSSKQNSGGTSS